MRNVIALFVFALVVSFVSVNVSAQLDEEAAAQAAEQAGKLREAMTHYVTALQSTAEGGDAEQRLREKIISLVLKLDPPPALPEDAIRYEGRAEAAVKSARTPSDYLDAANEYKKASRLAPWAASYYYNLGLVLEKAERRAESIRSLKLYLLAAPNARDAIEVRKKIAGLDYELEKEARALADAEEGERRRKEAEREERERRAAEERERQKLRDRLDGTWADKGHFPECPDLPGSLYSVRVRDSEVEFWSIGRFVCFVSTGRGRIEAINFLRYKGTVEGNEFIGTEYVALTGDWRDDDRRLQTNAPSRSFPRRFSVTLGDDGQKMTLMGPEVHEELRRWRR